MSNIPVRRFEEEGRVVVILCGTPVALTVDEAIDLMQQLRLAVRAETSVRCAFCDHERGEHIDSECSGKPKHEAVDASGACPCNGFVPRARQ